MTGGIWPRLVKPSPRKVGNSSHARRESKSSKQRLTSACSGRRLAVLGAAAEAGVRRASWDYA